jgi:hypothetical protein
VVNEERVAEIGNYCHDQGKKESLVFRLYGDSNQIFVRVFADQLVVAVDVAFFLAFL